MMLRADPWLALGTIWEVDNLTLASHMQDNQPFPALYYCSNPHTIS